MFRLLIVVLSLLPFTAWRADAQAMSRVRPPMRPTCDSMPTVGRTIGELCSATTDGSLRYWNGLEWVVIGTAIGSEFSDGCRWVHLNATGGTGLRASPWTGWSEQITGSGNYCFAPGYYAQEELLFETSISDVHIKCEQDATFLRQNALGSFFRNADDSGVSITNFSVEGCTFDENNIARGTVGGGYNYDATIGIWRTSGMNRDIVIRNNKWINIPSVEYTYYNTRPDSAFISIYGGQRFLIEGNSVIQSTFSDTGYFPTFIWVTAGEDIVVTDNNLYQAGGLKFESYNWMPEHGTTQKDMRRVIVTRNKFTNLAVTNIIFRNTCIYPGAEGPASIHDILVADNVSTVESYGIAGKGLVGVAATWAPDEFCTAPDGPIFSENVIFANNQMRGMRGNFMSVGGEGTVNHWGAVKNLTVIGNVADGAAPGDDSVPRDCDYENVNGLCTSFGFNSNVDDNDNLTIVGNTFKNLYLSCIYTYGKNITISGNTCDSAIQHEWDDVFYINSAIIAVGGTVNVSDNVIRNTGGWDHTLDGTNAFRVHGIFVPALSTTRDTKISNNVIVDERDHDIDGDGTIDDTNFDGTTEAEDQRAMDYGIVFGAGGAYGRYTMISGNQILGAITQPWLLSSTPSTSVIYGNAGNLRRGAFEIAPEVNEVTYGFGTEKSSCLSVTKDKKIFEDLDCDGILDVTESGVSDPTPLNSPLYSVGDEADTQPSLDPYIMSGTAYAVNARQDYADAVSVATALQMYTTSSGDDMMVNVTGQTDTSNIYAGLIPFFPFSTNFGTTIRLASPTDSAYLAGFVRTKVNKDIYDKTMGVFFWCDPDKDVDADGTQGDVDNDGTCGEGSEDDDDCNWYAVSMGGDGTNDIDGTYSEDDHTGKLADATYSEVTNTGISCVLDPAEEEYQNLSLVFRVTDNENWVDYYIDGVVTASHNYTDNHLPGAWPNAFVGLWAQTNSTDQTGFAWDFVGNTGYRDNP